MLFARYKYRVTDHWSVHIQKGSRLKVFNSKKYLAMRIYAALFALFQLAMGQDAKVLRDVFPRNNFL